MGTKQAICQLKAYATPPPLVAMVMEAVCILLGEDTTWAAAQKLLSDCRLVQMMKNYDKDNITRAMIRKLQRYILTPEFHLEIVGRQSIAGASFCTWVRAMYLYDNIAERVRPKRDTLRELQ